MSSKIYVLDGAIVECNQGFTPAKLLVTENQKVKIQGKFKATDRDVQVPQTFGQCKLKPTSGGYLPCIPGLQKWTKTSKKTTLGGSKNWLYEDSECMCATGGKVTITDPTQINSAGSAKEEFKNIAKMIPGAMMGNDKAPKVIQTYWMDESRTKRASKIMRSEKASIFVKTQNIDVGETVEVIIKEKKGKVINTGKDTLTYSGKVKADGTVTLDLVELETIDNTQQSSQSNATAQQQNAISSQNTSANTNEKEILETGVVEKGNRINEDGKIIIVNSKGKRAYDWIYADQPSEKLMKANGMTDFDVTNINLTKSYPTLYLKAEMKAVLWGFSDIEDGFGKNGIALANHFFTGQGQNFIFDNSSNPVREIKDSAKFKNEFLPNLKKELVDCYNQNKYVSKSNNIYRFSTSLPYYSPLQGANPNVNEIATFVGGMQGCLANYQIVKENGELKAEISNLTFFDTFGAGWEDGGADGAAKQWIPGLVAMFCLQHFKNVKNKTLFQPFTILLNVEL
ncbi:PAAR-like protein [Lacinutrix salivirga]